MRHLVKNKDERLGLIFGFIAVMGFSITLPATRVAVTYIDPVLVGLGRSFVVALPALLLILFLKVSIPSKRQWLSLLIVMFGVVICFPWLTSLAMQNVSGAEGGIAVSMIPLFTAISGALILGQRPSIAFWMIAILGSMLVLVYLWLSKSGDVQPSELILFGASIVCAVGYAEGAKLARDMGGLAVISWALILSIPFTAVPLTYTLLNYNLDEIWQVPWQAWVGFLYISIISQWFAFVFWYRGLALGGIVRVSQVQLIQPFLTMVFSSVLLGESLTLLMILFAIAVVTTVAIGRRMTVY